MHQGDEDNSAKSGSKGTEEELISVGLNSLWGMVYMIMEKTHMSWNEIMWKRSWINIEMMLADSPKMVKKNAGGVKTVSGKEMARRHKAKK